MGIYVNPGNHAFEEAINSKIYIDKSGLIAYTNSVLNTSQKNICVSRPRRFGKSMAADMLTAYYSKGCDSGRLFSDLTIHTDPSYPAHLNKHHVIRLDIQRFLETEQDLDTFIHEIEKSVITELIATFPKCTGLGCHLRLKAVLDQIRSQTAEGFIFIIDEWDCVFRFAKKQDKVQKTYLDFLRGIFKGSAYTDLAYMTGILPIKKFGDHSALNMFDEYSMIAPKSLEPYFGFTDTEVQAQCKIHDVDYAEAKKWYDGYLIGSTAVYNPKSVTDALIWKEFQSYWTGTETYEALKKYIGLNYDGLKESIMEMLGNVCCLLDPSTFQNDMTTFRVKDDILTLLVHLGYLTYDKKNQQVFIPNQEVAQEFWRAVKADGWNSLVKALERSEELLKSTWAQDGKAVADTIAAVHQETASLLKYNNENSLACTVLMAYYSAKLYYMHPVFEMPTGEGFSDIVYLPKQDRDLPALVIELKWNRSANGAIKQIKNRQYAAWIREYTGEILLVGISYSKKTKKHECVIQKDVK